MGPGRGRGTRNTNGLNKIPRKLIIKETIKLTVMFEGVNKVNVPPMITNYLLQRRKQRWDGKGHREKRIMSKKWTQKHERAYH